MAQAPGPKGAASSEALALARELESLIKEKQRRTSERKLLLFKPEPKQLDIMCSLNRVIGVLGGNRSGKSECGGAWAATHATGLYPDWWTGVRHSGPTDGWAAGITNETTRDIIQDKLLGNIRTSFGTGFIPKDLIVDHTMKPGVKDAVETIYVRHASGGISTVGLKSMEQGPSKFMGTEKHWIWLDEEPDKDGYQIFSECKMRTMTVPNGQTLVTYTPLNGMSELCVYLIEADDPSIKLVTITWEDALHLDKATRDEMERTMLPHEREARMLGKPVIKEGLIYPFMEKDILVDAFPIPIFWPHVIGMDVARTGYYAAVIIAVDPRTDVAYVINEYKKDRASREEHAAAILKWGEGIYVAIDPSSNQGEADGTKTIKVLKDLGLNVHNAHNKVEGEGAGIQTVFDRFSSGKLKIFRSCRDLEAERRLYQFKDGKVRKTRDHLLDCMRYGVMDLGNARSLSYFRQQWMAKNRGVSHGSTWRPGDARVGY